MQCDARTKQRHLI